MESGTRADGEYFARYWLKVGFGIVDRQVLVDALAASDDTFFFFFKSERSLTRRRLF